MIDDTFYCLAGLQWFSMLRVLASGNGAKRQRENSFTTGNDLWQFKVMSFGLCNAPATFERLMERMLAGLPPKTALHSKNGSMYSIPRVCSL